MDRGRLLLVDDEASVRASLRRVLEPDGYTVTEAADGPTALTLLQSQVVHVLISDQMMPGMCGIDLLKLVRVRHPDVVRILLTADPDPETPAASLARRDVPVAFRARY